MFIIENLYKKYKQKSPAIDIVMVCIRILDYKKKIKFSGVIEKRNCFDTFKCLVESD